jgi:putative hydrolase of the HAD superfamily
MVGMAYSILFFDADNTLFDYEAAETYALRSTCEAFGLQFDDEVLQRYKAINAEMWRDFEQGEIKAEEINLQRFDRFLSGFYSSSDGSDFSRSYLSFLSKAVFMIPGALEVVRGCSTSAQLVLLTNGLESVQKSRLSRSPLKDYFTSIVISEEVGYRKPQPEIFEIAASALNGFDKSDVLMVGDSLSSDIQGAMNYGIDSCWYNPADERLPAEYHPRYCISRLEELLPIVN